MKERRPDRNQVVRDEAKRRFAVIAEVKRLAENITTQEQLDAVLAQKEDVNERRQLFAFISKFITAFTPKFPISFRKSDIVRPS